MQARRAVLAATVLLALAGCAGGSRASTPGEAASSVSTPAASLASPAAPAVPSRSPARSSSSLAAVHDPDQVTGTLNGPCLARDHGRLPDRRCTPGAVDPAVTQAGIRSTICVPGYTSTVRPPESQTEAFKFGQAYPAYGLRSGARSELDHLVPLELGGANDAANLWPETGPVPNPKDAVENALHRAVCDGRVSLARAQRAIARNWESAESRLGLGAPAPTPSPAPTQTAHALSCSATVSNNAPADYTTVDIEVRTAAGASVTTVAHYKTTSHEKTAVADGAGSTTVAYYISGATPGYTVTVDVTVSAGSKTADCSTSFTPVS